MYDSVKLAAGSFLAEFEGRARSMYLDQKCLVTTGIGFLIAKREDARKYKWVAIAGDHDEQVDTQLAADEWAKIKNSPESRGLQQQKLGWFDFITRGKSLEMKWNGKKQKLITLQLAEGEIEKWTALKAVGLVKSLKTTSGAYFGQFDEFPADAQLGILTLIWANGADYLHLENRGKNRRGFPTFCRLCKERKWGDIATAKPPAYRWKGMLPRRERAMYRLFMNAENLEQAKKANIPVDFKFLHYPTVVEPLAEIHDRIARISLKE